MADADEMAGLAPLDVVEGEGPAEREARLIAHIGRHLTGRDLALRTEFRREIARLDDRGDKMDAAMHHMGHDLAAEVRERRNEDRRIDDAVREIPNRIIDLQDAMIQTKTEVIQAIQGARSPGSGSGADAPPPPLPPALAAGPGQPAPTLGWLVAHSRPVQVLVLAMAAFLAAGAVGVLSLALGADRAGDVAADVVDKIPRYRLEAAPEPPTSQEPPPGSPPEPQP